MILTFTSSGNRSRTLVFYRVWTNLSFLSAKRTSIRAYPLDPRVLRLGTVQGRTTCLPNPCRTQFSVDPCVADLRIFFNIKKKNPQVYTTLVKDKSLVCQKRKSCEYFQINTITIRMIGHIRCWQHPNLKF